MSVRRLGFAGLTWSCGGGAAGSARSSAATTRRPSWSSSDGLDISTYPPTTTPTATTATPAAATQRVSRRLHHRLSRSAIGMSPIVAPDWHLPPVLEIFRKVTRSQHAENARQTVGGLPEYAAMVTVHVERAPRPLPRVNLVALAGRSLGAIPPPAQVLAGILCVQVGAALAKQLFGVVGSAGAVALRLFFAAL